MIYLIIFLCLVVLFTVLYAGSLCKSAARGDAEMFKALNYDALSQTRIGAEPPTIGHIIKPAGGLVRDGNHASSGDTFDGAKHSAALWIASGNNLPTPRAPISLPPIARNPQQSRDGISNRPGLLFLALLRSRAMRKF